MRSAGSGFGRPILHTCCFLKASPAGVFMGVW